MSFHNHMGQHNKINSRRSRKCTQLSISSLQKTISWLRISKLFYDDTLRSSFATRMLRDLLTVVAHSRFKFVWLLSAIGDEGTYVFPLWSRCHHRHSHGVKCYSRDHAFINYQLNVPNQPLEPRTTHLFWCKIKNNPLVESLDTK